MTKLAQPQFWHNLKQSRAECQTCPLFKGTLVPPVLPPDPKFAIVGEAPGSSESISGLPFIGSSGKLLNALLHEAQLDRRLALVTNTCLCYLPTAPTPTPQAIHACSPLLEMQLAELPPPRRVLAVGGLAVERLAGTKHSIIAYRGTILEPPTKVPAGFKATLVPEDGPRFKTGPKKGQVKPIREDAYYQNPDQLVVVPTLHPSFLMRTGLAAMPLAIADVRRFERLVNDRVLVRVGPTITPKERLDPADLAEFISRVKQLVLDLETDATWQPTILGLATSINEARAYHFDSVLDAFREWLLDDTNLLICHNASFDIPIIERYLGHKVKAKLWDTMWAAHFERPDLPPIVRPKALETVASRMSTFHYTNWKDAYRSTSDSSRLDLVAYNELDCAWTWAIFTELRSRLSTKSQLHHFENRMMPALRALINIEQRGVRIDTHKLHELFDNQQKLLDHHMTRWPSGCSPWQGDELIKLVYKDWKLPIQRNKSTGRPTLDQDAIDLLLEKFPQHDQLSLLGKLRHLRMIRSTFLEPELQNGRIHTHYKLVGAYTGRLSSSNPNLQNIPKARSKCPLDIEGCACTQLRSIFVPESDHLWAAADYSQIEYRISALLSGERQLIDAYQNQPDFDIHANAAQVLGISRSFAKSIVHGTNYGMGPKTVAKRAGIPLAEAQNFIEIFVRSYPHLSRWRLRLVDQVMRQGYVSNPFGRRFYFERKADPPKIIAAVPQSTAADVMLVALAAADQANLPVHLTVHDELGISVGSPEDLGLVRQVMEGPIEELGGWYCPCSLETGTSWGSAKNS